jgi:V/A-type H+-transporting ATPase subunit I
MSDVPLLGRLNTVFVLAIGFGMLLILLTMILNMINALRRKDFKAAFLDTNGLAGFIFYGAVVTVVALLFAGKTLPGLIVLLIMFILPLLLIGFKDPIMNLILKKPKLIEEGKGIFFVQVFCQLFEILLSYFSNTFLHRIGAFAISHAAIMEVVLMLSGAENGTPNILGVILGNLVVIGLEGLIVGIQVLRLEYYELFSRFYKGTGRVFDPFKTN